MTAVRWRRNNGPYVILFTIFALTMDDVTAIKFLRLEVVQSFPINSLVALESLKVSVWKCAGENFKDNVCSSSFHRVHYW